MTSMPITAFVPHRDSMLLIDELVESTAEAIVVRSSINASKLFVTEEGLPAHIGIELMAQTMACWSGIRAQQQNTPVQLGFLLGTRSYESTLNYFPFGSVLTIKAREEMSSPAGLAVFSCEIFLGEIKVAWAQMNAFQPPDVERYLAGAPT